MQFPFSSPSLQQHQNMAFPKSGLVELSFARKSSSPQQGFLLGSVLFIRKCVHRKRCRCDSDCTEMPKLSRTTFNYSRIEHSNRDDRFRFSLLHDLTFRRVQMRRSFLRTCVHESNLIGCEFEKKFFCGDHIRNPFLIVLLSRTPNTNK